MRAWIPARSRRWFLRGLGGAAAMGLTSCAADQLAAVPRVMTVPVRSGPERVVAFANWPQYIDQAPANPRLHPTLAEFTRQTGITVDYSVPISSNQKFLGQIGIPLALGKPTGYDLVVLSDWVVAGLIPLGWLERLSPELIPNAARLLPLFRDWPVPDVRRYSLPWQAGFTGIAYNERVTGRPVTSMTDLLTSRDLRGRVSLVAGMHDVMGLVMLEEGIDPSAFRPREFTRALAVLARAAHAGQIRLVSDYYLPALIKGTVAAGVAWAGDVLETKQQHPYIHFTWPRTGGMTWTDNMVIPALAQHWANAERLMNFYYRPEVAVQLSAQEQYLCPVLGAAEVAQRTDPALAGETFVFPTKELLSTAHLFRVLTPAENFSYAARFESVVGL